MEGGRLPKQMEFSAFSPTARRMLSEKLPVGTPHRSLHDRNRDARILSDAIPPAPPQIMQRIDDVDPARANSQAQEDTAGGATGLSLVFEGAPNAFGYGLPATAEALARALEGIALDTAHLRIDAHPLSRASTDWLVQLLGARQVDPGRLHLSFGIDPVAIFGATGRLRMSLEALQASMPQSLAHFFALGIPGVLLEADGRPFHNAGATEAQELGIMLSGAVSHLRMFEEARQPLVYATPHIGFALCVDHNLILSIAKISAMRRLWQSAQEMCAINPVPCRIHAETSWRMMTRLAPETNIPRMTLAGFAAVAGGADSLAILPHSIAHGLPDGFARRVARNIQLITAKENNIENADGLAADSDSLKTLTEELCQQAWGEFQTIEAEGGLLQSLAGNHLQTRIREARQARAKAHHDSKYAIVGTTLHPASDERPVSTLAAKPRVLSQEGVVFCEPLRALRIDETIGTI